jgi:hypothetical protein
MVDITRRGALAGLAVLFGAAVTISPVQAASKVLAPEPVSLHRHIFDEMVALGGLQASFNASEVTEDRTKITIEMSKRIDVLLGYMHNNIADKNVDVEDIRDLFHRKGLYEKLPLGYEGFLLVPEASIPIVVMKTVLCCYRVKFSPQDMQNWQQFVNSYSDAILSA